jgi:hypothetical protein
VYENVLCRSAAPSRHECTVHGRGGGVNRLGIAALSSLDSGESRISTHATLICACAAYSVKYVRSSDVLQTAPASPATSTSPRPSGLGPQAIAASNLHGPWCGIVTLVLRQGTRAAVLTPVFRIPYASYLEWFFHGE